MKLVIFLAGLHAVLSNDLPTPFPTLTPAPESQCSYQNSDEGPFALDCLQAVFLEAGCSARGTSYPTNTRIDEVLADKEWYNAHTWSEVNLQLAVVAVVKLNCRGPDTPVPTLPPTLSPVTPAPSPHPTLPPTSFTPAPVDDSEAAWTGVATNDGNVAADGPAIQQECTRLGYMREYDDTNYVIRITMDGGSDYYTTSDDEEICDILADPTSGTLLWSDRVDGEFMAVDAADVASFTVNGSSTGPSGRVFSSWLTTSGTGGYGSSSPGTGIYTGSNNKAYSLALTSTRTHQPCFERVAPQDYVSPCARSGTSGQKFSPASDVRICDDSSNENLLYAIANRQFGTCDTQCVFGLDYDPDNGFFDSTYFWTGTGASGCWRHSEDYGANEWQTCDTKHNEFSQHFDWEHAQRERARLCKERCDYVNGWIFSAGSCYRLSSPVEYSSGSESGNTAKGVAMCNSVGGAGGAANAASINSPEENAVAQSICGGTCFFGAIPVADYGTADGAFADGTKVGYTNWRGSENEARKQGDELAIESDGHWTFVDAAGSFPVLCETAANTDDSESRRDQAETCLDEAEVLTSASYPSLNVLESGFTDALQPGYLHVVVDVPKTMFAIKIGFENSTNDAAEYSWEYTNDLWEVTTAEADCESPWKLDGGIPWTVFNLGGAGGVERLATWEEGVDAGPNTVHHPEENTLDDGSGTYYQFGAVVRIEATQPLSDSIDLETDEGAVQKRKTTFDRQVVVRVPFVLRFQKTITVTTDVNIISTKFNYKTVAAIIQSIQYDTQYFKPPYAKVKLQIRTKSQYPYLFNTDVDTATLTVHSSIEGNENVGLELEHLADDVNCTFTNPDHMREGDICTQEWMLYITPEDNVCYATGEYSITYTAGCFYDKEVCYLPQDATGSDITDVTFTFKVQTSKFCPEVADEVDLSGGLVVTGRESFKPDLEGVEDNTEGTFYMQGETIHFLATTSSTKAKIIKTEVIMIEIAQDLDGLVQTGYNRVPYDPSLEDRTIWMSDAGQGTDGSGVRVAGGMITVDDGTDQTDVTLLDDDDVYNSGHDHGAYTFADNEAGFKLKLHSRVFPVNVDSFGTKSVLATLEVTYDALDVATSIGRRRLLTTGPTFDLQSRADFKMSAWAPRSIPNGLGEKASMAMEITITSQIRRTDAKLFSLSVHEAIVTSLNEDSTSYKVYDNQVSIDAIYSDGVAIWTRPVQGQMASRRLLRTPQSIRIEFTFANIEAENAMPLSQMTQVFDRQLRSPTSSLMTQPVFFESVIGRVEEITTSNYQPNPNKNYYSSELKSSASRSVAPLVVLLLVALWQ